MRGEKHVTLWNKERGYKISGNSAPQQKNIDKYLTENKNLEKYNGQDKDDSRIENWRLDTDSGEMIRLINGRVSLRNKETQKILGGNSCPLFQNVNSFLEKNPHYERIYPVITNEEDHIELNAPLGSVELTQSSSNCKAKFERVDVGVVQSEAMAGQSKPSSGCHDNIFEVPMAQDGSSQFYLIDSFDEQYFRSLSTL